MNTRATTTVRLAALAAATGMAILISPAAAGTGGGGGRSGGGMSSHPSSHGIQSASLRSFSGSNTTRNAPNFQTHAKFSKLPTTLTPTNPSGTLGGNSGIVKKANVNLPFPSGTTTSGVLNSSNVLKVKNSGTFSPNGTGTGVFSGQAGHNITKVKNHGPFTPTGGGTGAGSGAGGTPPIDPGKGNGTGGGSGHGSGNGNGKGKNHWYWNWGTFGYFPPFIVNPIFVPTNPVVVPGSNTTVVVSSPVQPAQAVAAPIAKGIDLQLVDVRLIDAGKPTENVGPAFRVSFRNTGAAVVDHEFNVALMAGIDGNPSEDLPQVLTRVGTFNTKDVMFVDLRLPASVFHMPGSDSTVTFSKLFVFVDSHQEVNDANRENNLAGLDRTTIQPVK